MRQDPRLKQILATAVQAMGCELVGVEYHPHPRNGLLRVYIDTVDGVTLDDCQRVSEQISGVLDVEDPIPGHYTLEVSSPGLDRPLFEAEHFVRFTGHKIRVHLSIPLNGRSNFAGRLLGLRGDDVLLECDGQELSLPLERVEKARLVPEFQGGNKGEEKR
ncbi:MAG: ribosome maturation factor RimP [Gammaproteobacteria bacterium]|nr:ribosome maturation factor RimP [Gammaproteobacteria bacterium]MCP5425404.1 ribosome maturation factor RimP [Gammaproteobacteria bacterium]MCP5459268.1 ribosome maturation factor RimP [Gammaproteobacteria bacterium]